ncbi:hypothetical protein [Persephonella sp.]
MEDKKWVFVYLLIISSFISISLFEVFVVIGILWAGYEFFKERKFTGNLRFPVLAFSGVSMISTVLFAPKMVSKAIEEGIFQLLYFFRIDTDKRKFIWIVYLFIGIGFILIPIIVYRFLTEGQPRAVWGSTFEVGQFYAEFTIFLLLFAIVFFREKKYKKLVLTFVGILLFLFILYLTHRRSPILGFLLVSFLLFIVLYKNRIISKKVFIPVNLFILSSAVAGYIYLSLTDVRFQILNDILTGKQEISFHTLNRISSARVVIGTDAINIIKNDIKEGNWANLLIGHGVRSGYYLPHQYSPQNLYKYESVFILSEFIEKGSIGLIAIIAIFFIAFKTFLTVKITDNDDIIALGLFVPLLIHLVGSIFTFFWDALLPMYLLLFKIGEVYFRNKSKT